MASGRTHEIINLIALPPTYYLLSPNDDFSFLAGYLVGTFLITPDNDLFHSRPIRRWKILKFIWYPYTKFSAHRGLSHIPILGTLIKLFYVGLIFAVLAFSLSFLLNFTGLYSFKFDLSFKEILFNPHLLSFVIGVIVAEFFHILTDMVYSSLKRLRLIR